MIWTVCGRLPTG